MTVSIRNEAGNSVEFGAPAWSELLRWAYEFGWVPQGTERVFRCRDHSKSCPLHNDSDSSLSKCTCKVKGKASEWLEEFVSNSGRVVNAEDATRLADALEHYAEAIQSIARAMFGVATAQEIMDLDCTIRPRPGRCSKGKGKLFDALDVMVDLVSVVRSGCPDLEDIEENDLERLMMGADFSWVARVEELIAFCRQGSFTIC